MMAKKPDERFASFAEVIGALEAVKIAPDLPAKLALPPAEQSESPTPTVNLNATAQDAAIQNADLSVAGEAAQVGAGILLVEPSRTQAAIIRKFLLDLGFEDVVTAPSGQKAIQIAHDSAPGVVISALHLPDMTGVQLAQQIRGACKGAAPGFVLISSEAESSSAGSLSKCGKAVLLLKPFTPGQLADALKLVSEQSQLEKPASGWATERGTVRVLIVDDSAPARLHVRNVLEELGLAQFVEAADGAQAVVAVSGVNFDLIVTDYNMPYMDGRGLVTYLKKNPSTATVPIIMVTTEKDPIKLDAVRLLGVAAVCDKSFRAEEVRGIIDSVLRMP
jgi:two-component system chemotaxis response regulator CheY